MLNNNMSNTDSKLIWEQYDSPGRQQGGSIPYPDGRGEMEQPNGYTDTGFEELHDDLKNAMMKALEMNSQLPDEKKGDDYEEVHYNLMQQLKTFINELDVKIHN